MTLQTGDLNGLVYHIFEIDSYKSKMGADEDIITISFSLKTQEAADDLSNFIEKGYNFVLDTDATPGQQDDGTYKVFVEMERTSSAVQDILQLVSDIEKLTKIDDFKFRYYKGWKSHPATEENLESSLPTDPREYKMISNGENLNNYKNFFNKSFLESVELTESVLTIRKKYADPLRFRVIDFGNKTEILENTTARFNIAAYPELLFLTKYIGDYNISKYGDNIMFENNNKLLVVQRI
jgi:hypothetical protein